MEYSGVERGSLIVVLCRVEKDAQLLANRIALLKQEQMRTWKKIEETKKRATEVMVLKQKNEDRMNKVSSPLAHTLPIETC